MEEHDKTDNAPVASREEAARTNQRLTVFVTAESAPVSPDAVNGDRRKQWIERVEYDRRRRKYATMRRQYEVEEG